MVSRFWLGHFDPGITAADHHFDVRAAESKVPKSPTNSPCNECTSYEGAVNVTVDCSREESVFCGSWATGDPMCWGGAKIATIAKKGDRDEPDLH